MKISYTLLHENPSDMSTTPKAVKKTVRKPRQPRRGKSSSRRMPRRHLPQWARVVLLVVGLAFLTWGFYALYIRPFAYRWKPCYGQKGYGVCIPCRFAVHGIDVSHHQGYIDWDAVGQCRESEFPIHFVFMKATEGGDYSDDCFQQNFEQAHEHGLIRGAYHYYLPQTDALKQADFFIRNVHLSAGDLPPVLDVEVAGKRKDKGWQEGVKHWLERVESHYGVKPILYTSYRFKERYLNDSAFNAYPYWIAHYYVDSVRYEGKWAFWQHTDAGDVPGIRKAVDLNVFNGSLEELQQMTIRQH